MSPSRTSRRGAPKRRTRLAASCSITASSPGRRMTWGARGWVTRGGGGRVGGTCGCACGGGAGPAGGCGAGTAVVQPAESSSRAAARPLLESGHLTSRSFAVNQVGGCRRAEDRGDEIDERQREQRGHGTAEQQPLAARDRGEARRGAAVPPAGHRPKAAPDKVPADRGGYQ